jgi:hypothetical protein
LAVTPYVLFFIAGLGFGYAAPGAWKWLPLAFPVALALMTALQEGVEGVLILRLAIALALAALGVLLGVLLERRGRARLVTAGGR